MEELKINKIVVEKNNEKECYYYEITNVSSGDVFLKDFIMYEADSLNALQVEEKDCVVFRSGRHKNDIPSIFKLGCMDDAMKDALGSMSESGDKLDADGNVRIIESDHLTILGNENGYTVITFPEGRKQLFATDM